MGYPLRPGDVDAPDSDFQILTQMPVKSIITQPPRCTVTTDTTVLVEGRAWSGAGNVTRVEVSYDTGLTWAETSLQAPVNTYAWQSWSVTVKLPSRGVWFILARATDHTGATQPLLTPPWNPGGYANNQAMKVDVEVRPKVDVEVRPLEERKAKPPVSTAKSCAYATKCSWFSAAASISAIWSAVA